MHVLTRCLKSVGKIITEALDLPVGTKPNTSHIDRKTHREKQIATWSDR